MFKPKTLKIEKIQEDNKSVIEKLETIKYLNNRFAEMNKVK